MRFVHFGSVTRTFRRSASSGFSRGGAWSSDPASSPWPASFSPSRATCSGSSRRPPLAHGGGERLVVALAVDLLEQPVHQRPELDHLAVGAAHQRHAVLVAGAADLPDQLQALRSREGARSDRRAHC
jgi:hypothetical protein